MQIFLDNIVSSEKFKYEIMQILFILKEVMVKTICITLVSQRICMHIACLSVKFQVNKLEWSFLNLHLFKLAEFALVVIKFK